MTTSEYHGTPDGLTAAWHDRVDIGQPVAFPAMIDALRELQDQMTGSRPPEQVATRITGVLSALTQWTSGARWPDAWWVSRAAPSAWRRRWS
jgi:hypothetical protein